MNLFRDGNAKRDGSEIEICFRVAFNFVLHRLLNILNRKKGISPSMSTTGMLECHFLLFFLALLQAAFAVRLISCCLLF